MLGDVFAGGETHPVVLAGMPAKSINAMRNGEIRPTALPHLAQQLGRA
jgi:hypothetical protein